MTEFTLLFFSALFATKCNGARPSRAQVRRSKFHFSGSDRLRHLVLIIAPLLGHSGRGITSRYANAPESVLIAPADRISLRPAEALDDMNSGKVVSLRRNAA